jgi:putative ABC transport system ATP-binding protein
MRVSERAARVIDAEQVVKVFDEGAHKVEVLRGVSLQVSAGEVVALEGPSGSGKTTLLSILGCILTPTSGRITVAGETVDSSRPERLRDVRRRSIGFVFQQYNLFPALSALENVEYALNVKGATGREARGQAQGALERVGLGDRLHFLPRDLSGGQKQRVAIARALAGSPQVILADEPTANLDSAVGAQVLELFRDLAKAESKGVLIVTHDPKVRAIADRVVGIHDGRLAA